MSFLDEMRQVAQELQQLPSPLLFDGSEGFGTRENRVFVVTRVWPGRIGEPGVTPSVSEMEIIPRPDVVNISENETRARYGSGGRYAAGDVDVTDIVPAFSIDGDTWPVKTPVRVATLAALPVSRVGNVLTATANGLINTAGIDDVRDLSVGQPILVKDQGDLTSNGIYTITSTGSAGTPYVLTRRADLDDDADIADGFEVYVEHGTFNGRTRWSMDDLGLTLNTDAIELDRVLCGYTPSQLDPPPGNDARTEHYYRVDGPMGGEYTVVESRFDDPLFYSLTLRRRARP